MHPADEAFDLVDLFADGDLGVALRGLEITMGAREGMGAGEVIVDGHDDGESLPMIAGALEPFEVRLLVGPLVESRTGQGVPVVLMGEGAVGRGCRVGRDGRVRAVDHGGVGPGMQAAGNEVREPVRVQVGKAADRRRGPGGPDDEEGTDREPEDGESSTSVGRAEAGSRSGPGRLRLVRVGSGQRTRVLGYTLEKHRGRPLGKGEIFRRACAVGPREPGRRPPRAQMDRDGDGHVSNVAQRYQQGV